MNDFSIKLGKQYKTASGELVKIIRYEDGSNTPYCGDNNDSYTKKGSFFSDQEESILDLVEEVPFVSETPEDFAFDLLERLSSKLIEQKDPRGTSMKGGYARGTGGIEVDYLVDLLSQPAPVPDHLMIVPVNGEHIWDGLPRQIMMWLDFERPTPKALFKHLKATGTPVPQWMHEEPELKQLDHVPSKGTRCVMIYRAMLDNVEKKQ